MEAINREKCYHGRFGMESGSNQPREVLSRSIWNGKWKQSTERSVITVDSEWRVEAINREKCYHGRFGIKKWKQSTERSVITVDLEWKVEAINRGKCYRSIRNGKWKQSTERSVITVDSEWRVEAINREKCYHGQSVTLIRP